LLGDSPILVLDEPTAGLDPAARRDVWDLISTVKRWGRTVILTTHYLEEAELLSDHIGILQGGELKRLGTLEDLYRSVPKTYRLVYDGVGESQPPSATVEAMSTAIQEIFANDAHVASRVEQVNYLWRRLKDGVPLVAPSGGHGVFINVKGFCLKCRRKAFRRKRWRPSSITYREFV
jgi:ABC-type multidrug transport system ATPase subunit